MKQQQGFKGYLLLADANTNKLGIYEALGDPTGDGTTEPDIGGWKESIIS